MIERVEPLARRGVGVAVAADLPDLRTAVCRPDRLLHTFEPVGRIEPAAGLEHHDRTIGRQAVGDQRPCRPGTDDTHVRVIHRRPVGPVRTTHSGPWL